MGPITPRPRSDDDIDDFMASLIRRDSPPASIKPKKPLLARKPVSHQTQSGPTRSQAPYPAQKKAVTETPRRTTARQSTPRGRKFIRPIITMLSIIVAIAAGVLLWQGPVSSLLQPKSPFSEEITSSMNIPLFYPTSPPAGFKIEVDSVTQPEPGVVLYVMSDEEGNRINLTLQRQPEGINLDPLYAALISTRELTTTKFGTIKTGITTENISITNILTGQTWILINMPRDTINDEVLVKMIDSFREIEPKH